MYVFFCVFVLACVCLCVLHWFVRLRNECLDVSFSFLYILWWCEYVIIVIPFCNFSKLKRPILKALAHLTSLLFPVLQVHPPCVPAGPTWLWPHADVPPFAAWCLAKKVIEHKLHKEDDMRSNTWMWMSNQLSLNMQQTVASHDGSDGIWSINLVLSHLISWNSEDGSVAWCNLAYD